MDGPQEAAWQRGFMTAFVAICLILVIFIVCKKGKEGIAIPSIRGRERLVIPRGGREWMNIPRMNQ